MALVDNFDSYSTGDLNGQGSWSGAVTFDVVTDIVQSGDNAMWDTGITAEITASIAADAAGVQQFYWQGQSISSSFQSGLRFRDSVDTKFSILLDQSRIRISGGGIETIATSLSDFTWYKVDVQWDAERGVNGSARARQDDGAWTDWIEASSSFTEIDELLIFNGGGANYRWDSFSEPTAETTTTTTSSSSTTTSNTSTSSTTSSSSSTTTSATSTSSTTTSQSTSSSTTTTGSSTSTTSTTTTSNTSTSSTTSTSSSTTTGLPFMIPNLEITPTHT